MPLPPAKPTASPGRPKDLAKRAAILDTAERLFLEHGYEGVSMDQIAAGAGVSKLTVYSHFGDKDALFAQAAKAWCEQQMPGSAFDPAPEVALRERLLQVAGTYFAMITQPEALSGHRLLCSPQMIEKGLARMFWESGSQRVHRAFAELLRRRIQAGDLEIPDVELATTQFFSLLKGDIYLRMVFDCCDGAPLQPEGACRHVTACVDMFLRAYPARSSASSTTVDES